MKLAAWYRFALAIIVLSAAMFSLCNQASAQICKPVSQRTSEVGCWIIAQEPVGQLTASQTFWHLDAYPSRDSAEAAKGPSGTIVESLGKIWLLTIANAGWRPSGGERIAEIGPLPVIAGEKYSAQYMEAIFDPGMTAPAHVLQVPKPGIGWPGKHVWKLRKADKLAEQEANM